MSEVIDTYRNKAPRVAELLTRDIGQGVYAPGTMLPPDGSLAESYNVSRITMRRALSMLAETGQVVRLPNRGVLVPTGGAVVPSCGSTSTPDTKRKAVIGVSWSVAPDYNIIKTMEGIERYTAERGTQIRDYCSSSSHARTLDFLNHVDDYGVDGVLVMPFNRPEYVAAMNRLVERRFPMVSLRDIHGVTCNTATRGGSIATHKATHYLIEKYRRPVYYISEAACSEVEIGRRQGYEAAMCEAGYSKLISSHTLRGEPGVDEPGAFDPYKRTAMGYGVAKKFLPTITGPVSILCINDYCAQAVYEVAEQCGLSIGKDVCVIGFDNLPLAESLKPGLTTIACQHGEVGYQAMWLVDRIIASYPKEPITIEVPCEFVIRGSA